MIFSRVCFPTSLFFVHYNILYFTVVYLSFEWMESGEFMKVVAVLRGKTFMK
jgi:hypothetical protein